MQGPMEELQKSALFAGGGDGSSNNDDGCEHGDYGETSDADSPDSDSGSSDTDGSGDK